MANQVKPQSRPLIFEDDPPTEARFRRVQPIARKKSRTFDEPADEFDDTDDEDSPRFGSRFGGKRYEPAGPWYRPSTTTGRVLFGVGALLVLGCVITSVVMAKRYLSRDARFRIAGASSIEATGLGEVSRSELLPVFGEDIGRNIFFVPLSERRKQVEAIPWVHEATVMRLLPDRIRVSIVERQPVAFVRQGQQVGLVDGEGVLLGMPAASMAQHHYSFPVVTGIAAHDPLSERRARMAVYQRLLGELDSGNQHLSQQISEIDLTDPQDARVLMPEQGADILAHFGDDKFLDRYHRYKTHIAEWRQQYPKLAAVDLRYESQVVLEMPPGTNAVAAALGADGGSSPSLVAAPAKPPAGVAKTAPPAAPDRDTVSAKPTAAKFVADRAAAPAQSAAAPSTKQVAAVKPPAPKQAAPKQVALPAAKTLAKKATPAKGTNAETLAARQRAARLKAAQAKAKHQKGSHSKKQVPAHRAVLKSNQRRPSTSRTAAAEGQ